MPGSRKHAIGNSAYFDFATRPEHHVKLGVISLDHFFPSAAMGGLQLAWQIHPLTLRAFIDTLVDQMVSINERNVNMSAMLRKFSGKSFGIAAVLLLTITLFPLGWAFPTFPGDEWSVHELHELETDWLDSLAVAISLLGWMPVSAALMAVLTISLFVLKRNALAIVAILSVAPMVLALGLKAVVGRPRPELLLAGPVPHTLSFPSGHAEFSIIFCGFLILRIGELIQPRFVRLGLQFGLVLLIIAEGASRVYLGAHWPSDVIGGYMYGGMTLLGLLWLRNRLTVANKTINWKVPWR